MKKFSVLGVMILLVATATLAFAQARTVTVQMRAVEGSRVAGTAIVTEAGGGTRVQVNLTGYNPNQQSAGHIHEGTCEQQGPVRFPLNTITANAQGAGTADTTVATAPYATVTNGRHYVQYHEAGSPPGKQVSCANIPAGGGGQGGAAPTGAPATGFGGGEGQDGMLTWLWLAGLLVVIAGAGAGYTVVRQRGK